MNIPTEIQDLHQQLIAELQIENDAEMAQSMVDIQDDSNDASCQTSCNESSLSALGLDIDKLSAMEQQTCADDEQAFDALDQLMTEQSHELLDASELDLDSGFLPEDAQLITPSWSGEIAQDNDLNAQAVIGGGTCKNLRTHATGSGWGCTGGRATRWRKATWVFWFRPSQSRFYAIKPRFVFRGYYIAKANDKWYNCKNSQVKISAQTNVFQYNWKGLRSVNMVNINKDNVNLNRRLDDTRYTNYSALLGKNDWVAVVCSVKLYVRAQGGGSAAKVDFSTGANKVCVPHIIVS